MPDAVPSAAAAVTPAPTLPTLPPPVYARDPVPDTPPPATPPPPREEPMGSLAQLGLAMCTAAILAALLLA